MFNNEYYLFMSLKYIDRRERMLKLRKQGATYEEIAAIFALTRQRVHQIVNSPEIVYPQVRKKVFDKDLTQE